MDLSIIFGDGVVIGDFHLVVFLEGVFLVGGVIVLSLFHSLSFW
jgi:hypothetical protein